MLSVFAGLIAFLAYGIGAVLLSLRGRHTWPNFVLAAAAALTAVWAGVSAAGAAGYLMPVTLGVARTARDFGWFAVIIAFLRQDADQQKLWRWLGLVAFATILVELYFVFSGRNFDTGLGIRLTLPVVEFATSLVGLILVENLVRNLPAQRVWSLKLLAIGLAAVWI